MKYSWNKRRPDIHSSTLAWEASWQQDFDQNFRSLAQFPSGAFSLVPSSITGDVGDDQTLLHLQRETRSLCKLQFDLASEAARRSLEGNFDEGWKALSVRKRQDFILKGLVRTMSLPDMEERRKWCPESTLKSLNAQGGAGYMHLLRQLKPADIDAHAVEPILIPHEVADRVMTPSAKKLQEPGVKTMLRSYKISRSYCLTTLVWNIFLAYHGEEENQYAVRAPGPNRDDRASVAKEHRNLFQDVAKVHNAVRRDLQYSCFNCGKTANMLPSETVFQTCSKCRPIGRKVVYCSRECQVNDWKNGQAKPHKQICGKPLKEDELLHEGASIDTSAPNPAPWLPSADPSFKRSPALLLQLRRLAEKKEVDYVIATPYGSSEHDYGIQIPEHTVRAFFLVHRNRALRTGDASSVSVMYNLMCRFRPAKDSPELCAALRKQLKAEFGVTVREWSRDDLAGEDDDLPRPTKEELEFVVGEFQHDDREPSWLPPS